MNALLIMALTLVVSIIVVVFLPLPVMAISILVGMLGGNALMAIVFAIMANNMD